MNPIAIVCLLLGAWLAPALLHANPAAKPPAGPPPDGIYNCTFSAGGMLSTLGKLELRDGRYRGFSGEHYAPYEVDDRGVITLSEGLRGMPEGTTLTEVRHVGPDRRGRALIKIYYRNTRGAKQVIDATLLK